MKKQLYDVNIGICFLRELKLRAISHFFTHFNDYCFIFSSNLNWIILH